ncbi:hypothetical protein Q2T42_13675 [Leptolyngbya boryana CZ1]|uniref:Uncharacterized protein n=1 Tax=Leptolyngbya boryana CZ1 TaxID=3060204 RepID=A0AA96XB31_LEPBY|nr:hypothetical protein [Leptolyngbya boryana]WNZ48875.1 hypothetical protein Q2T42_13675 [Leptolyngbya boryana CZ1]
MQLTTHSTQYQAIAAEPCTKCDKATPANIAATFHPSTAAIPLASILAAFHRSSSPVSHAALPTTSTTPYADNAESALAPDCDTATHSDAAPQTIETSANQTNYPLLHHSSALPTRPD